MPLRRERRRESSKKKRRRRRPTQKSRRSRWEQSRALWPSRFWHPLSLLAPCVCVFISTTERINRGNERRERKWQEKRTRSKCQLETYRPAKERGAAITGIHGKCFYYYHFLVFVLSLDTIVFSRFLSFYYFRLPLLFLSDTLSLPSPPIQSNSHSAGVCVCTRWRAVLSFLLGERSARAPHKSPSSNRYSVCVCARPENHCRWNQIGCSCLYSTSQSLPSFSRFSSFFFFPPFRCASASSPSSSLCNRSPSSKGAPSSRDVLALLLIRLTLIHYRGNDRGAFDKTKYNLAMDTRGRTCQANEAICFWAKSNWWKRRVDRRALFFAQEERPLRKERASAGRLEATQDGTRESIRSSRRPNTTQYGLLGRSADTPIPARAGDWRGERRFSPSLSNGPNSRLILPLRQRWRRRPWRQTAPAQSGPLFPFFLKGGRNKQTEEKRRNTRVRVHVNLTQQTWLTRESIGHKRPILKLLFPLLSFLIPSSF